MKINPAVVIYVEKWLSSKIYIYLDTSYLIHNSLSEENANYNLILPRPHTQAIYFVFHPLSILMLTEKRMMCFEDIVALKI